MIDWTPLYKKYKGEWVALEADEVTVVAHGLDARKVWQEAKSKVNKPILLQIPKELTVFVGYSCRL